MALTNTAYAPRGNFLSTLGEGILNVLVAMAEANGRVKQVERFQAMSDAELSARGMKREDIVHHVFRDVYYV